MEAARLMVTEEVKCLTVVDEADRWVGVVSRGDLLRVSLRRDDALREETSRAVLIRTRGPAPTGMTVDVDEGRVTVGGRVDNGQPLPVIERLCLGVDGVASVDLHVTGREDRTRPVDTLGRARPTTLHVDVP